MTEKDELREHSFDGIQEYDNDLPKWWVWLFWLTIIFSVLYPFVYDFGPAQFASETIDAEMAALQPVELTTSGEVTEQQLIALAADQAALSEGQQVYATRCMACHGDKGQGLIGPNLADDYWIHGGKATDMHRIVVNGVLDKGMLAWKGQLTPEQINAVVAFIWTLHGTNPPNAKAPQGDKVERSL